MATARPHAFRFANPAAACLAPGERGVRLRISGGAGCYEAPVELYVHPFTLRSCSGVLAAMLESCCCCCGGGGGREDSSGSSYHTARSAAASGGGDPHLMVPLPGDDAFAWDDALGLMYSVAHGSPFEVTWESAKRLLALADKYDMRGVTATVAAYLRTKDARGATRLEQRLACGGNAWRWLRLARKAGLDDLVALCVRDIARTGAGVTAARLRELDAADADALLEALAAQRRAAAARAEAAEAREGRLRCEVLNLRQVCKLARTPL